MPRVGQHTLLHVGYLLLVIWVARAVGQRYQVAPFAIALIGFLREVDTVITAGLTRRRPTNDAPVGA